MSTQCPYQDQISSLLFEDLDSSLRAEYEGHLEGCLVCRQELERCRQTLEALQSWPEGPVPRHFFVSDSGANLGLSSAISLLSPVWKGALAAAALLAVTLLATFASGLHVSASSRGLTVGWAPPEPAPVFDEESFQQQLVLALEQRLLLREQQLLERVRQELSQLEGSLDRKQQASLKSAVDGLQGRLETQLDAQLLDVESGVDEVALAVHSLSELQSRALQLLNQRIDLIAIGGEIQGSQSDLLINTLIEMADLRERNPARIEGEMK